MTKIFKADSGVLMDASFIEHERKCAHCADANRKAGALCLEGSVLYKRLLVDTAPKKKRAVKVDVPDLIDGDAAQKHRVSKREADAAMRYK